MSRSNTEKSWKPQNKQKNHNTNGMIHANKNTTNKKLKNFKKIISYNNNTKIKKKNINYIKKSNQELETYRWY